MARSVQWRRVRPDAVARRADEALRKTLYIVHQSGPTGFVLKEDHSEEKHKVMNNGRYYFFRLFAFTSMLL